VSEEKKANYSETAIIREQIASAREHLMALASYPEPTRREAARHEEHIANVLTEIERANDARDKSRKLSFDVTMRDLMEPMVKALLSQGFELALAAVVPQLKTVVKSGNCTCWTPPVNPFRSGAEPDAPKADPG